MPLDALASRCEPVGMTGLPVPTTPTLPGVLRYHVLAGSHAYGLAGPGSDADWRGVYQLPTEAFLSLRQPGETVELPPDQTYYELRHFFRLCLAGNPNIMELLWLEPPFIALTSPVMERLRGMRSHFFGRQMLDAYLGWAMRERLNMAPREIKVSGQGKRAGTPADWKRDQLAGKAGSHLIRLLTGLRGALLTGELRVTMQGTERDFALAVKHGQVSPEQVMAAIEALEAECRALGERSGWGHVDPAPVEALLLAARRGELG